MPLFFLSVVAVVVCVQPLSALAFGILLLMPPRGAVLCCARSVLYCVVLVRINGCVFLFHVCLSHLFVIFVENIQYFSTIDTESESVSCFFGM